MENQTQKAVAVVTAKELSLVENNLLNEGQLKLMLSKTPDKYIHKRPGKGGKEWEFVTGGYMKKVLNLMFGWDWDFQIINFDMNLQAEQAIVHGQLTIRVKHKTIIKHQFGRADIKFKRDSKKPLDLGNDLKAATTDALKKCASELGLASDIYNKLDFMELQVRPEITVEEIMTLYLEKEDLLTFHQKENIDRIVKTKEVASYKKAYNILNAL